MKSNYLKNNPKLFLGVIFLFLFIFLYRDFLHTYRVMLDGDFRFYKYYKILLYYKFGLEEFKDYIPVNTRYLGIWISYIFYEYFPCLTIGYNPREVLSSELVCAIYSFALMNYLSKIFIFILCFIYFRYKLKKNIFETFIAVILCQIFLMYVENFTLDRFCIFYIFLCIYNYNNKFIFRILLLFSFLVNEKIIIIFGLFIFLNFLQDKKNIKDLIIISLSCIFYIVMIYILINYFDQSTHPYFDNNNSRFSRLLINPLNKSHISNSFVPILISIIPYVFLTIDNKKNNVKKLEILIPIFLIFLGYGGGENNLGRYAMHCFPIYIIYYVNYISKLAKKYA